ncbi:polyprenyl synthetase family protein [Ligilactobacillus cholophilus]|uniref:polyprenyl synthetase family protein n=1 Tax=Ligilactobacillus cholophilus TaxID=3050131 RepID=UPI0025B1FAB8|nr:farnesyl diphosphate synthase [Ligilactobacillus cholophilus]
MKNNLLNNFIDNVNPQLNNFLDDYLKSLNCYSVLNEAMRYSVDAGGKRIRPILILAIVKSLKNEINKDDIKVASSLELIHTYSLIHDDLPEMDNDDLRRGKPTNHKVFGQAMAVLAGDALLTTAFECICNTRLNNDLKIKLISGLSKAAGPEGMINGQVGDIQGEKQEYNLSQLRKVHLGKTAALLKYACYAGSLLGNANQKQEKILVDFGEKFGLAFQIYDDILDVIGNKEQLGKNVHKDNSENKNTYPILLGLDGAKKCLNKLIGEMSRNLNELSKNNFDIELLMGFLEYFKY